MYFGLEKIKEKRHKMSKNLNNDSFGGNLTDLPNEKYKKFFDTFYDIESLDVTQWRPSHIIGYFCKKYKDIYGTDYKFKFNSASPAKCFEVFQIKKLAILLSSSPVILKGYIDWVYSNKVVKAKRRFTSISFFTNEGVVNEYKINVLLAGKQNLNIDRSTPLPDKYKCIFKELSTGLNINTYGDLAFVSQMNSNSLELDAAMLKIQELGFDKEILNRII
jgi:hypothetical protein